MVLYDGNWRREYDDDDKVLIYPTHVQWEEGQVALGTSSCSLNVSVISQQKWLKFGLQAHFLTMFGHTKFQLSISCTRVVLSYKTFSDLLSDFQ